MTPTAIVLNGKPYELAVGDTVADLVHALGLPGDGRGVAVALGGAVLAHGAWSVVRLAPDEQVEIVVATQGG